MSKSAPPSNPRSALRTHAPAIILAMLWCALVAWAWWLHLRGIEVPLCTFKRLTGRPCPTCGSTRAAWALLHADIAGALRLNPLMTAFMLAAPFAIASNIWRTHQAAPNPPRPLIRTNRAWVLITLTLLALVALNWYYTLTHGL